MEKEKKFIYLLIEVTGQYEDMYSHTMHAYYNKEDADKECERLQEYYDKLWKEYNSIEFDVDDKKHNAFMELLKEVNPEEYARAKKAFDEDDDTFDYDKFYNEKEKFYKTPELYDYLSKTGCTEKEIHLIDVEQEVYEDLNYDFPSFHVSHPIELT